MLSLTFKSWGFVMRIRITLGIVKSLSYWSWRILLWLTHATLTLNLLTTTIVAPPSNASKWQMGFNSAFKWLNKADAIRLFDAVEFVTLNTSACPSAFAPILPHFKLTSLRHDSAACCGLTCQLVISHMTIWKNMLGPHCALKCWVLLYPCNWWCWGTGREIRGCKLLRVRSCHWQLLCGLTVHKSLSLHQDHPYCISAPLWLVAPPWSLAC